KARPCRAVSRRFWDSAEGKDGCRKNPALCFSRVANWQLIQHAIAIPMSIAEATTPDVVYHFRARRRSATAAAQSRDSYDRVWLGHGRDRRLDRQRRPADHRPGP